MTIRQKDLTQFANEAILALIPSIAPYIFLSLLSSFTDGCNEYLHLVHHEDKSDHISTSRCGRADSEKSHISFSLDVPQYLKQQMNGL
jgi:hypothetical protein